MRRRRRAKSERGFTLVELLAALTVLTIGVAGIAALESSTVRASAYSRHRTEAAVLAEDKMEELRTRPAASIAAGTETLNADGKVASDGFYRRSWNATTSGTSALVEIVVTVSWTERGSEPHAVILRTRR